MFMPEGKLSLFALEFRVSIVRPEKKCLIQNHADEALFHIEAILILT
jgi:hypothetical protein